MDKPLFYDSEKIDALHANHDLSLRRIDQAVAWEGFRPVLDAVWRGSARRSGSDRPPWDSVLMFKMILLGVLNQLSDDRLEEIASDRHTFRRFLGLRMDVPVPDAKTAWAYREQLAEAGAAEELFAEFNRQLMAAGFVVNGGQLIDSTCVPAPRQHNTGEENRKIKDGVVPDWQEHKRRQKDTDANHARKHGVYYYGHKNHVNADQGNKLIWSCAVTPASAADVTHLGDVLLPADVAEEVYADRACHSRRTEELLTRGGGQEPDHAPGRAQPPLGGGGEGKEPRAVAGARARGARVRLHPQRAGREPSAVRRDRPRRRPDRTPEPGLQHEAAGHPPQPARKADLTPEGDSVPTLAIASGAAAGRLWGRNGRFWAAHGQNSCRRAQNPARDRKTSRSRGDFPRIAE